jgi:hypothetical protein
MLVSSSCFDAPRALMDVIEYLLGLCRVSRRTEFRIGVFEVDKRQGRIGTADGFPQRMHLHALE